MVILQFSSEKKYLSQTSSILVNIIEVHRMEIAFLLFNSMISIFRIFTLISLLTVI